MTWLRELWCWLTISGLKQPYSLVWVTMHCNVSLVCDMSWRIMFYFGTVSVVRRLNLWHKPNGLLSEGLICDRCRRLWSAVVPTTTQLECEMSGWKFDLTYCLTWYHAMGGLISHQECNALKLHCVNTKTYWDGWHLSPGACGNGMTRP